MRVKVRFFAQQREQLARREQRLELPDKATIGDAWARLVAEHPVLDAATSSVRFARNARYAGLSEPLADGDEIAIIPPVAGGAEHGGGAGESERARAGSDRGRRRSRAAFRRIELTLLPIDGALLTELRRSVATTADGAIVYFLGQTRETPGTPAPGQEEEGARHAGQRVESLEYEVFSRMTLAVLEDIADEIEDRFDVRGLAVVHRIGRVDVGDASVVVATAAPHRDAAFAACRYAIDELKARAPIWKSERFADGSVWLGAPARVGPVEPRPAETTGAARDAAAPAREDG